MEHGHSLVIPPHFDGNNYAYWKVRMKVFLKHFKQKLINASLCETEIIDCIQVTRSMCIKGEKKQYMKG